MNGIDVFNANNALNGMYWYLSIKFVSLLKSSYILLYTDRSTNGVSYDFINVWLSIRKSLFVVRDIEKNEIFSENNIRSIRPSGGLHPKYFKKILGKKSKFKIKFGTALKLKHF